MVFGQLSWRTLWHRLGKRGKVENSAVFYSWRNPETVKNFRSGVSLHSHTNQSRETLKFLACLGSRFALMRRLMHRLEQRCETNHGRRVDYRLSYWTPPARPELAFNLESGQIEKLDLAAMVSLTDHDSIQTPLLLQPVLGEKNSPVSVEWTVPYGPQTFHLGIHNLPRARACEWMQILASYTVHPSSPQLRQILAALHAEPEVLVIFNHPMWDLYRVGGDVHIHTVNDFLRENRAWIHAIELNGLRNWQENRETLRLAEQWGIVLISGGDRHGLEPNANINLTDADCFDEFVHEIRHDKRSTILFMPQYAQPWKQRILRSAIEAVSHYPQFPPGSQRWDERVFHPDRDGIPRPLSALWPDGTAPNAMRWSIAFVQLLGKGIFARGLGLAWCERNELRRALGEQKIENPGMMPDPGLMSAAINLAPDRVMGRSD